MEEKTKRDYRVLFKNLANDYISGEVTPNKIREALIEKSKTASKGYWQRVRCAAVFCLEEKRLHKAAKFIQETQNKYKGCDAKQLSKPLRKVTNKDHMALINQTIKKGDHSLWAALTISWVLGCRPIEMMSLELLQGNQVFITGAKKTESGKRGLDRQIILTDDDYKLVSNALPLLLNERWPSDADVERAIGRLRRRLENLNKKLFPKRKRQITFYSYRHQMGSNLKSSDKTRPEIAAIMGHQSVNSVNKYGDRRQGKGSVRISVTNASIASVRVTDMRNPNFKEILVNEKVRAPDKTQPVKAWHTMKKIG